MKKLMSVIFSMTMVLAMSLSVVNAKPSITANGSTVGNPIVNGEVRNDIGLKFTTENKFEDVKDPAIVSDIDKMNSGVSISTVLSGKKVNIPNGLDFAGFSLLTQIQDLILHKNGNRINEKNVKVSWEVSNLVSNLGDVYVLHYSTVRNVWEVLKPDDVNYSKKTITCTFPDLSPVAVIYRPSDNNGSENEKTDDKTVKTGDNTQIALYAGAGLLALVVLGTIVYKKKRED